MVFEKYVFMFGYLRPEKSQDGEIRTMSDKLFSFANIISTFMQSHLF